MNLWARKFRYLGRSLVKSLFRADLACPSCGCRCATVVDRKMIVTTLRRCRRCELLFRAPTTAQSSSIEFYQNDYQEGFTTELPSDAELSRLTANDFKESNKDYSDCLTLLQALRIDPGRRLLDFGCSWGYGTWQLQRAGYDVHGYEISKLRCSYARMKLAVNAVDSPEQLSPPYDCFFSAHVLEHVPNLGETFKQAWSWLRPGGIFMAFTPNGSETNRSVDPWHWHRRWGDVHPQLLDEHFCERQAWFGPRLLDSRPFDVSGVAAWDHQTATHLSLTGDELLIVFKKQTH
jgi:SAM-dependent methyltransferase